MSITASATSAPATQLVGPARRDAGQRRAARRRIIAQQLGQPLPQRRRRQHPAYERPLAGRRGAADPGQRAERLRGRDRVVGRPARSTAPASRAISARIVLAQLADRRLVGRVVAQPLAGQPAGARAAATGRRRAPRRRRPRSPAIRRRCRRRAAGPTTSRTTGVRRGTSASPRPRRGAPRGRPRSRSARGRAPRRCSSRPGPPRSRSRASPRSPCPRPPRARRATNAVSASMPRSVIAPSSSRCSASRSGSLNE